MSALVEGKNAHVVCKHLGHEHVPARFARECLSPFLNFHSPCLFATERVDAKGSATASGCCRVVLLEASLDEEVDQGVAEVVLPLVPRLVEDFRPDAHVAAAG